MSPWSGGGVVVVGVVVHGGVAAGGVHPGDDDAPSRQGVAAGHRHHHGGLVGAAVAEGAAHEIGVAAQVEVVEHVAAVPVVHLRRGLDVTMRYFLRHRVVINYKL